MKCKTASLDCENRFQEIEVGIFRKQLLLKQEYFNEDCIATASIDKEYSR